VSEEIVERVRQPFLRSQKKSVRRASRELEMSSMQYVEDATKETENEVPPSSLVAVSETSRPHRPNYLLHYDARRRNVFFIVLCLVMSLRFISVGKCTEVMCVYGVLKILTRWWNMKGVPQRSVFFWHTVHTVYGPFLFRDDTGRNKLSGNATHMALP
jgi:hypothetical protein